MWKCFVRCAVPSTSGGLLSLGRSNRKNTRVFRSRRTQSKPGNKCFFLVISSVETAVSWAYLYLMNHILYRLFAWFCGEISWLSPLACCRLESVQLVFNVLLSSPRKNTRPELDLSYKQLHGGQGARGRARDTQSPPISSLGPYPG